MHKNYKIWLFALIGLWMAFAAFHAFAQVGTKITAQTDGVIVSPDAVLPNIDGTTNYKGKISSQVLHNIKSKNGKVTGAICDGTSNPASEFYGSLGALQADYSTADALTDEIDGVVIEQLIADQVDFFVPAGTCLMNKAISQSSKTVRIVGEKGKSIIKANPASRLTTWVALPSSNLIMEGITFDGNDIVNTVFRQDTGYFEGYDIEAKSFGDSVNNMGSTSVVGFMFDDPFKVIIKRPTCSDIQSKQDGQIGQNDGLARCIQIGNATVGTSYGYASIEDFYFDATGSKAPQLDGLVITIDSLRSAKIINPVCRYNEFTRRCIKIQPSNTEVDIVAPDVRKTATFAADSAGTTDVGSYVLNLVDCTATTGLQGSMTVHGGYIDASGAVTGLAKSSGTCRVRAEGTTFIGSTKRARKLVNIEGQVRTASVSNISGSTLTLVAHLFNTAAGASVVADAGSTLPTGLSAGTLYYTRSLTADTLSFHPTLLDATNNTNAITPTGGSGTFQIYTGLDTDQVGFFTDTQSGYGSGVENTTFVNFTMPIYVRAQYSFVRNSLFYDPVEYWAYIGTSSNSDGYDITNNTVYTVTSGYLNNTRVARIFDVSDARISGNRLVQQGNTGHATRFLDSTDVDSTGIAVGNFAPVGTTAFHNSNGRWVMYGNKPVNAGLVIQTTAASNSGTGEDNLQAVTLQASPLFETGSGIRFDNRIRFANNANAKTLKCYWGTTQVFSLSLPTSVAGNVVAVINVAKTGTNTQDIEYDVSYTNSGGTLMDRVAGRTTGAESETASLIYKCTGEATTTSDITQEMLIPSLVYN